MAADMARIAALAAHARKGLRASPGVTVEDAADRLSGLVAFRHDARPAPDLQAALRRSRISIAAPPSVRAPLRFGRGHPPSARVSPHACNAHEEIDRVLAAVAAL